MNSVNLHRCLACSVEVDANKLEGWNGRHRYRCVGPSTWEGFLDGFHNGRPLCWCGEPAVIQISRGLSERFACSPAHGRSRKTAQTARTSPFAPFVLACYTKGVPK